MRRRAQKRLGSDYRELPISGNAAGGGKLGKTWGSSNGNAGGVGNDSWCEEHAGEVGRRARDGDKVLSSSEAFVSNPGPTISEL